MVQKADANTRDRSDVPRQHSRLFSHKRHRESARRLLAARWSEKDSLSRVLFTDALSFKWTKERLLRLCLQCRIMGTFYSHLTSSGSWDVFGSHASRWLREAFVRRAEALRAKVLNCVANGIAENVYPSTPVGAKARPTSAQDDNLVVGGTYASVIGGTALAPHLDQVRSSLEIPVRRPWSLAMPQAILGVLWARPKRPSRPNKMIPPWPWSLLYR